MALVVQQSVGKTSWKDASKEIAGLYIVHQREGVP